MIFKNIKIIDYLVIIFQVGYHLSIVSDWLMMQYHIGIFVFMIIAYLLRFKGLTISSKLFRSRLYIIFFIICFFDILQFFSYDFGLGIIKVIMTFNFCLFLQYLNNLYSIFPDEKKATILLPYTFYGGYNIITIIIAALLIYLGVLSATTNPVAFSIMENNMANGMDYYFPGFLSVIMDANRVLLNIPLLTGLSHEPHVLCFLVMPVAFLLLGVTNKSLIRILIYVAFAFVLVVSMSTTAIIAFGVVLLFELVWSIGRARRFSNLIIILLLAVLASKYLTDLLSETQLFMTNKFDTDTGSLNYSENLLKYVVTPTEVWGTGNIGLGDFFKGASSQIGFITSFLDVLFYAILCIKIVKLIISKNKMFHYVGLACLYFVLHLLKVSFLVFNYPYLIFMMFIIERFSSGLNKANEISR